jgi:hypothetical protein
MTEVTVPTAPALATVANVELMHTGTWSISNGTFTFSTEDLRQAVAAVECPAVRRPVLKLGHAEPDPNEEGIRWDGEPAVGWIANLAVAQSGRTLVGDYVEMPGWLGGVIASAYPDRSIEGHWDWRCQLGHVHPFVVTAVALLGVVAPGIGTLQSLQDVAALYGVTAAEADAGTSFAITVHAAAQEDRVPNPRSNEVAAGVTTEDVRRAFYGSDYGKSWDIWVTEMQLGPELQLIVCDDANGTMSRVPVIISGGDGEDAVAFGDPVKVVVRYEDAPAAVAAAAGSAPEPIRFASRAESRPGDRPAAATEPADTTPADVPEVVAPVAADIDPQISSPTPVAEVSTTTEGAGMDPAKLREALGLLPEATDDEVTAAISASGLAPLPGPIPEPEQVLVPAPLPAGVTTIDEAALADLLQKAEQGVAARAQQLTDKRDRLLDDAVKAGKFPPARRDHWENSYRHDPDGTEQALASLAPGLIPLQELGAPGDAEHALTAEDESFDRLFSQPVPAAKGA